MPTTLTELQEHYVHRANAALAHERTDLLQELNEEYVEEALDLILASA